MSKLLVVKYGGSVLRDGETIRQAAEQVKAETIKGNHVVVVVSALKGVTDELIKATKAIHQDPPRNIQDHIIRLGEEQSTRLFTSALELMGVHAEEYTVDSPSWPIITDECSGDAEPIMTECRKAVMLSLKPSLDRGVTPVVCGFVGRSQNGLVTTLGRGGTDTTATVLSRCLGADELVLVKDVGGVFSADPLLVQSSLKLNEISAKDAYLLSNNGAKVLHDKVFRHKNPELPIRIISETDALTETGTTVTGELPDIEIKVSTELIHEASLIGENAIKSQVVCEAVERITAIGGIIHGVRAEEHKLSICFTHDALTALKTLHELVAHHGVKAISLKENLRRITIQGKALEPVNAKLPLLLGHVYRLQADSVGIVLTLENKALDEVLNILG